MSLYVVPCKDKIVDGTLMGVSFTTHADAEFWALYRLDEDGTSEWISDHDTEAEARAAMERAS